MTHFRILARLSHPLQLILAALTYVMGAGIARYLGHPVQAAALGLGLLAVLAVQVASYWLVEYFRLPLTPRAKDETPRQREALRVTLFQSSMALLTVCAAVVVTLLLTGLLSPEAEVLLGLVVIFFVAYAVPPFRFSEKGYGELILAIYMGTLAPVLAFLLQYGEFHRLLTFASFPLTLLALAYFLVNDFPTFASDQKRGRHSLLTRLTWQRAIPIHHFLVLAAYLLFAASPFIGIPWGLVWPALLVLPFAIIQVIWLQRIALGGRTLWNFLTTLAVATFGLTAYLLAFTFWIR
jgi:1,4-dihydroxy-2-naphthoate octaprenyltransferase